MRIWSLELQNFKGFAGLQMVFCLDSIPEVRIIEGKDKV
jgi:hypothetical protein